MAREPGARLDHRDGRVESTVPKLSNGAGARDLEREKGELWVTARRVRVRRAGRQAHWAAGARRSARATTRSAGDVPGRRKSTVPRERRSVTRRPRMELLNADALQPGSPVSASSLSPLRSSANFTTGSSTAARGATVRLAGSRHRGTGTRIPSASEAAPKSRATGERRWRINSDIGIMMFFLTE